MVDYVGNLSGKAIKQGFLRSLIVAMDSKNNALADTPSARNVSFPVPHVFSETKISVRQWFTGVSRI
jgi:hypothetical protein